VREFDPYRRRWLHRSLVAGGVVLTAGLPRLAPAGIQAGDRPLTRIAFGSCCRQTEPQPIWRAINDLQPELFVFLGDNVYGDTRDMSVLQAQYDLLAANPGFRTLRERTPILATWDDHDFGEDDAGADYPMKEESRRIFCDFWGEAAESPRRVRDGIYQAYLIGPPGRRVQFILPDLRFNRTPLQARDLAGTDYETWAKELKAKGRPVPGPYERNPSRDPTMLGENQWRWLEQQLAVPADMRVLCSSLQVVADFPGWEAWVNYTRDQQRLFDTIRRHRAQGLFCISGDTHYGELSLLDVNVPYPMWDLTSSGLTEVWPVVPPNGLRVGPILQEANFGLIEIDWNQDAPGVSLQLRDVRGETRLERSFDLQTLRLDGR
jgi:alkaline phosphatase D